MLKKWRFQVRKRITHMNKLFTIGFAGKNAEKFFRLLKNSGGKRLIDIRLNNVSQLAGFTKRDDLRFFLKEILNWDYFHCLELAPTKDILDGFKSGKITWPEYEKEYFALLSSRKVESSFKFEDLNLSVLLCSESRPEQCHRRLAAEYLKKASSVNFEICHLF